MITAATMSAPPPPQEVNGPGSADPVSSGERYTRVRAWRSRLLPTPRDLFIHLPEAYFTHPDLRFPVLLLHDGQNLFDGSLSYVKNSTWRAGIAADEAAAAGEIRPVVLVGIANAGAERMAEYTPTADARLGGGRGPLYTRMLTEEVLPYLHRRYRLLRGPQHTGIAGSSLGGLISLWAALTYPRTFGLAGVLSPSLWWNGRSMLQTVASLRRRLDLRLWIDIGTAEGAPHVQDAEALVRMLQRKVWQNGRDLAFHLVHGGTHSEEAWAARFGDVLRFLYPALRAAAPAGDPSV